MMKQSEQPIEVLQDIRQMMQQSTRFLSLSGLSGVFAGVYALGGAWIGNYVIFEASLDHRDTLWAVTGICAAVLALSILTAFIFSSRKARRTGSKLFDSTGKRLFWHMFIPLATGGILCIALITDGGIMLVAPVMLIFYGLALINGSKYTLRDIGNLGFLEVILGLIAAFYRSHGLLFWTLGFGVLHILYGTIMWYKYDRASDRRA
jgi:hypothetical protein